jgi:hypothetical protein
MTKIPYDLVAIEADKLIVRMALSSMYESYHYFRLYLFYLDACGWDEKSFDRETLRRIDAAWDQFFKIKVIWN